MLLSGAVDVHTATGHLGHADSSVTLRTCAHVLEQRDRDAPALLRRLLEDRAVATRSMMSSQGFLGRSGAEQDYVQPAGTADRRLAIVLL
jgi:hypothetical protein